MFLISHTHKQLHIQFSYSLQLRYIQLDRIIVTLIVTF